VGLIADELRPSIDYRAYCAVVQDRAVPATPDPDRAAEILALVRVIPEGFVVSYGELSPEAPRFAGSVLAATEEPGLPWHRVVRADGSLAQGDRQRRLLVAEGVPFAGPRVRMDLVRIPREALELERGEG
jgi:alkylated DNA nucleotide flippase Atl1